MLTVRDLMMPDPITLTPEDTLRMAAELLTSVGISGAPVVTSGRVVGMVSLTDLLTFEADDPGVPPFRPEMLEPLEEIAPEEADGRGDPSAWFATLWEDRESEDRESEVDTRLHGSDGPEWDPLDERTVSEVMTPVVVHVAPLMPVSEAARLMERERIHRVLVIDGDAPVGILSSWDIVRAVAQGQLAPTGPGPTLIL